MLEARNADGSGYNIAYKSWTQAEIDQSPSRQWQIDKVADVQGDEMLFQYAAQQEAGAWVVDQITLPGGDTIDYGYSGGFLSEVDFPNGSKSTFAFSDVGNGMVDLEIHDFAASPGSRHLKATITGSAATTNGTVIPTTVGLARMVSNGEDEVAFFNLAEFNWDQSSKSEYALVYEGGGKMRAEAEYDLNGMFAPKEHFLDGWDLVLRPAGYYPVLDQNGDPVIDQYGNPVMEWHDANEFSGDLELYTARLGSSPLENAVCITNEIEDHAGRKQTLEYDEDRNLTRALYEDGTFEAYCYNERQQVTRARDRLGNVTRYDYDSQDRVEAMYMGLTDSNQSTVDPYGNTIYDRCPANDIQSAEYSSVSYTYHASGNGIGKLATTTDQRGMVTDYVYDAKHRLEKVIRPADEPGSPRPEMVYAYDNA